MDQPKGYEQDPSLVCKLQKGIYGLKQSSRQWNLKISKVLAEIGFRQLLSDYCVYIWHDDGQLSLLCLYVDDGLIASTSMMNLSKTVDHLKRHFSIKEGHSNCFVGIETRVTDQGLVMHQQAYARNIQTYVLERFEMGDCKPVKTPGDPHSALTEDMCPKTDEERREMENVPYKEEEGALMFLSNDSRPDIAFQVCRAASFTANPGRQHWQAVKRIMRYLKGTLEDGIEFKTQNHEVKAFCDADYGANVDNRKSVSGSVITRSGGAILWNSRLQRSVAQSTTEAEYVAIAEVVKDIAWLHTMLQELQIDHEVPIKVFSDNQGAIKLVHNPVFHRRTKHIDIRHHYIRDEQENGLIQLDYIRTDEQPADMMTKSLCSPSLEKCKTRIGLSKQSSSGSVKD